MSYTYVRDELFFKWIQVFVYSSWSGNIDVPPSLRCSWLEPSSKFYNSARERTSARLMRVSAARTRINGVLFRLIISKSYVGRAPFLPSLDVSLPFRSLCLRPSRPLHVIADYVFCLHLPQVTLHFGYMPALSSLFLTILCDNLCKFRLRSTIQLYGVVLSLPLSYFYWTFCYFSVSILGLPERDTLR